MEFPPNDVEMAGLTSAIATQMGPDGSRIIHWSLGRPDGRRARLQVWFANGESGQAECVQLYHPDGLTPSILQRFAWARWLAVADASARMVLTSDLEEVERYSRSWDAAMTAKRPPRVTAMRAKPGRKGHPDSFYQESARKYQEYCVSSPANPTQKIAEEYGFSRSTAAGWVRRARQKEFLVPGRKGRPG